MLLHGVYAQLHSFLSIISFRVLMHRSEAHGGSMGAQLIKLVRLVRDCVALASCCVSVHIRRWAQLNCDGELQTHGSHAESNRVDLQRVLRQWQSAMKRRQASGIITHSFRSPQENALIPPRAAWWRLSDLTLSSCVDILPDDDDTLYRQGRDAP